MKLWAEKNISFCTCSAQELATGGCYKCRSFVGADPQNVVIGDCDSIYYWGLDATQALIDRFHSVVSYHHLLEKSAEICKIGSKPAEAFLKVEGATAYWTTNGDGATYKSDTTHWLRHLLATSTQLKIWGECGHVVEFRASDSYDVTFTCDAQASLKEQKEEEADKLNREAVKVDLIKSKVPKSSIQLAMNGLKLTRSTDTASKLFQQALQLSEEANALALAEGPRLMRITLMAQIKEMCRQGQEVTSADVADMERKIALSQTALEQWLATPLARVWKLPWKAISTLGFSIVGLTILHLLR
jgi:hypothetical protein